MEKRFKILRQGGGGCPTGSAEAGQPGLLRGSQKSPATTGCPIDFEQAAQFAVLPEGRTDQGEEAGETMRPPTQVSAEAQQDIRQQSDPDLPLDGAFAVPQKVGQLERVCLSSLKKTSMLQRQR